MRSIQEIDAELAEVDRQIAMRDALGYKMARTRAILDHDTSGLDRVYAALNQAEQNRIAREAQQAFAIKQMEAQQAFQSGEAEKTRAFQGEQNDLNRGIQAMQFANAREESKAKAMQLLQDAYTMREKLPLLADARTIKNADSALAFALKHAANQGATEEDIAGFRFSPESEEQKKKAQYAGEYLLNKVITGKEDRKQLEEKRKFLETHIQNYADDPSAKEAEQILKSINDKINKENDAEDAETEKQFNDTLKNISLKGNKEKAKELVAQMHNPYKKATLETALENANKRRGVARKRAKVDFTK